MVIFDHNSMAYRSKWQRCGTNRFNGAFYYSKEIRANIIPAVKTDRNWVTLNVRGHAFDHSIVFVHNNLHKEIYDWLTRYKDLVLVCGVYETTKTMKHLGKTIYLPLSIDVEEVRKYAVAEKTKKAAFAGRRSKATYGALPRGIDYLQDLPREELLKRMAQYEEIYAVGRTAIEAKALGCKVKAYDKRFPDPRRWKVLDNRDAAKILQEKLDKVDGIER